MTVIRAIVQQGSNDTLVNLENYLTLQEGSSVASQAAQEILGDLASADSGKGAALVTYQAPEAGSVPRTVYDLALETVSDAEFAAVGDGVADDKAALDNAMAAAVARGRILSLDGSKTYGVTGQLAFPAGLRLQTNGATLRDLAGTTSNTPFITVGENNWIDELRVDVPAGIRRDRVVLVTAAGAQIERVVINSADQQANTGDNDDAALRVSVSTGARIRHVNITNYDRPALFRSSADLRVYSLVVSSYVRGLLVEDCERTKIDMASIRTASPNAAYTPGHVGVLLSANVNDANRNVTLQDFVIEDAGEHGIRVGGPNQQSNIFIVRPRIKNCGGSGIKILGTDSGTPTELNKRIFITDPIIEDCASGGITSNMCGILAMYCEEVFIINPVVRKADKLYSSYAGIRVVAASDVTISNPRVQDAQFDGIYLDGSLGDLTRVNVIGGGWSRLNGRDGYRAATFTATITDCMVDGLFCWNNTGLGFTLAGTGGTIGGRPSFRFIVGSNTAGAGASDRNAWTIHGEGGLGATPLTGILARNGSTWNDHVTLNLLKAAVWTAL